MSEPTEKEPRGPVNLRIKFRSANLDDFIERYAVDVSRGGIFIRTREPLSVGTRLKLDFQLLEQGLLQGDGTVVWIRESDPTRPAVTPGMGVRFDQLTAESQPVLEKILVEKERLAQSGKIPGMSKSTAGMAVRRPTGSFSTVEAMAARTGMPPLPAEVKPPPPPPAEKGAAPALLFPAAQFNSSAQPVGAAPAAPVPAAQSRSGPQSTGFGRPRATTGMSTLRSAPTPQLFEAPTTEDIDKALSVLAEAPGPAPFVPPPPPTPSDKPSRFAMAAAPAQVRDDPSNEPTRVGGLQDEFGAHDAVTGKATVLPEMGLPDGTPIETAAGDDLTARAPDGSAIPLASQGEARSSKANAAALDAPLAAHLDGTAAAGGVVEKQVVIKREKLPADKRAPKEIVGGDSGQFRANATYRRPRSKVMGRLLLVLVILGGGAGAVYKLKLLDRLRAPAAPTAAPEATTTAPPTPTPPAPAAGTEAAGTDTTKPAAPEAPTEKAAAEAAKPPEAKAGEAKVGDEKAPAAKTNEKTAGETAADERAALARRKRRRAEAEAAATGATAPAAAEAAKPAAADSAKPAEAAAGAEATKPAAAEDAKPVAEVASVRPTLKVTSSPSRAEVFIDGNSVGLTPFTSRDIDPNAPHGITVKKDGFEPQDRMIGGTDWSQGKGGPSLKVNLKLRRAGAPAPPKEESGGKASDVEILKTDD